MANAIFPGAYVDHVHSTTITRYEARFPPEPPSEAEYLVSLARKNKWETLPIDLPPTLSNSAVLRRVSLIKTHESRTYVDLVERQRSPPRPPLPKRWFNSLQDDKDWMESCKYWRRLEKRERKIKELDEHIEKYESKQEREFNPKFSITTEDDALDTDKFTDCCDDQKAEYGTIEEPIALVTKVHEWQGRMITTIPHRPSEVSAPTWPDAEERECEVKPRHTCITPPASGSDNSATPTSHEEQTSQSDSDATSFVSEDVENIADTLYQPENVTDTTSTFYDSSKISTPTETPTNAQTLTARSCLRQSGDRPAKLAVHFDRSETRDNLRKMRKSLKRKIAGSVDRLKELQWPGGEHSTNERQNEAIRGGAMIELGRLVRRLY
ncbi:MAG: hypothetical protein M1828_001875 [Chrysothrix sp. TS-e1954]|nr:MAG: hypothetical protein M1828_001875 [Chrysothrix sp. TS-e1954]